MRNRSILVVDDDEPIRDAVSQLLEGEGWDVQLCRDGLEALHFLKTGNPPEIVLADRVMPKLSGDVLAGCLRMDPFLASLPFILMTADRLTAAPPGVTHLLSKPFDAQHLLHVLDDLTGRAARSAGNGLRPQLVAGPNIAVG
jgi:CheY-like chemotaxis protein